MGSTLWERASDIFRRDRDSILERIKRLRKIISNYLMTHSKIQHFILLSSFVEDFIILIQLQNANIWVLGSWFERDRICCFA